MDRDNQNRYEFQTGNALEYVLLSLSFLESYKSASSKLKQYTKYLDIQMFAQVVKNVSAMFFTCHDDIASKNVTYMIPTKHTTVVQSLK